jgi:putative FmdB family regulatory protein
MVASSPRARVPTQEVGVPTYQYACTDSACGHRFEAVQSFSDDPLTTCPVCESRVRKVFSSVGVVFKGSGFYRTDSRAPEKSASSSGSESGSGSGKEGSSSESSSASSSSSSDSKSGSGSSGSKESSSTGSSNGSSGSSSKAAAS